MILDPGKLISVKDVSKIRAALTRLVAQEGKDRAWQMVVAGIAAYAGIGKPEAAIIADRLVRYIFDAAPGPSTPPEPYIPGPTGYQWDATKMVLAGIDRDWLHLGPTETCRAAKIAGATGISLEMCGNDWGAPSNLESVYRAFLAAARAENLVLFVCAMNAWVTKDYLARHGQKYLDIILSGGPGGVIVQPVGETRDAATKAYEAKVFAAVKKDGFRTCYNGDGGRPKAKPSGYDYAAWHSPGVNATVTAPTGFIEISDHSQKIVWLGYLNAGRCAEYAGNARQKRCGVGIYGYVGMGDNGSPKTLDLVTRAKGWQAAASQYGITPAAIPTTTMDRGWDQIDPVNISATAGNGNGHKPTVAKLLSIDPTRVLTRAWFKGAGIAYDCDALNWKVRSANPQGVDQRLIFIAEKDGRLLASHYEWNRPGDRYKEDVNNILNGYAGIRPKRGDKCWLMLATADGDLARTNIVEIEGGFPA